MELVFLITSPTKSIDKELDEGLIKIGRALAVGQNASIAKAIFAHDSIWEEVTLKVMDLVNEEVDALCSSKKKENTTTSPFRHIPVMELESFDFKDCVQQPQEKSPFLYHLITSLVQ